MSDDRRITVSFHNAFCRSSFMTLGWMSAIGPSTYAFSLSLCLSPTPFGTHRWHALSNAKWLKLIFNLMLTRRGETNLMRSWFSHWHLAAANKKMHLTIVKWHPLLVHVHFHHKHHVLRLYDTFYCCATPFSLRHLRRNFNLVSFRAFSIFSIPFYERD